jgi:hypothetical protein
VIRERWGDSARTQGDPGRIQGDSEEIKGGSERFRMGDPRRMSFLDNWRRYRETDGTKEIQEVSRAI